MTRTARSSEDVARIDPREAAPIGTLNRPGLVGDSGVR